MHQYHEKQAVANVSHKFLTIILRNRQFSFRSKHTANILYTSNRCIRRREKDELLATIVRYNACVFIMMTQYRTHPYFFSKMKEKNGVCCLTQQTQFYTRMLG